MRFLGLDPGSLATGYGVIDKDGPDLRLVEAGTLSSPRTTALPDRLARLSAGLA